MIILCSDLSFVMRGLDPRIHLSLQMDCRVKFTPGPANGRTRLPGNDRGDG
jgi:hypothetical protein